MKKRKSIKIYKDKHGREYKREMYFVGGKMKFHRIYVIDGIPADEFYRRNATVIDLVIDGNFHMLDQKNDSDYCCDNVSSSERKDDEELPF